MISGHALVNLAGAHVGEAYVYGVNVPKNAADWRGPWDCAEFASWLVYQLSSTLYGCLDNAAAPDRAEAFTGAWSRDAMRRGVVPLLDAIATPGAFLLRAPSEGAGGHIALSDGRGGTVEAHSIQRGVIRSTAADRRWTCGVYVPGFAFTRGGLVPHVSPKGILRLAQPRMQGPMVRAVQAGLVDHGSEIAVDGVFGPRTQRAVIAFQTAAGLVPDGEVGPATWAALDR